MNAFRWSRSALLAAVALPSATSGAQAEERLKLDLRPPGNDSFDVPASAAVRSTQALVADERYVVTVSGPGTIWGVGPYAAGTCGLAGSTLIEPSHGEPARAGTWDAANVFAAPAGTDLSPAGLTCSTAQPPLSSGRLAVGFELDAGDGFAKGVPVGGERSTPRTDHTYSFQLTGKGVPLRLRFADSPVTGNLGALSINVRTAGECAAQNCLSAQYPNSDQVGAPEVSARPGGMGVLGARACGGDRVLSLRLTLPKGAQFRKITYYLNGSKRRVVSGREILIGVTNAVRIQKLRDLPPTTLALRIDIVTDKGKRARIDRRIARCHPRIKARAITTTNTTP